MIFMIISFMVFYFGFAGLSIADRIRGNKMRIILFYSGTILFIAIINMLLSRFVVGSIMEKVNYIFWGMLMGTIISVIPKSAHLKIPRNKNVI